MDLLNQTLLTLNQIVWGAPLLLLVLITGITLSVALQWVQFRYLGFALRAAVRPSRQDATGDISHFEALMTTLAGAIGTGSIVGVAAAVSIGGPGALFWMWVTALVGMAIKYAESLLAVKYRLIDVHGQMIGGPMEYMERGLGWRKIAILFAFLGGLAAISTGNMVQANSIAEAVFSTWTVSPILCGILLVILVGMVTLGGVKAVGRFAGVVVPFMALFYFLGGCIILWLHIDKVPAAFVHIFEDAFTGHAALGGTAGSILLTIQVGVARGIFTTEAGMGLPSIAAAAAKTDSPGRQAMIMMTGGLLSTILISTMTGLVLEVSGVLTSHGEPLIMSGASIAIEAFGQSIPYGNMIVTIGLILFAYTTIIAWSYYGEKCAEYLFGARAIFPYRILFLTLVIPGATLDLQTVWLLADTINGLITIPNLVALLASVAILRKETAIFVRSIQTPLSKEK